MRGRSGSPFPRALARGWYGVAPFGARGARRKARFVGRNPPKLPFAKGGLSGSLPLLKAAFPSSPPLSQRGAGGGIFSLWHGVSQFLLRPNLLSSLHAIRSKIFRMKPDVQDMPEHSPISENSPESKIDNRGFRAKLKVNCTGNQGGANYGRFDHYD